MSADTRGTSTSHAHQVDPLKEGKLADRSQDLKAQYGQAKSPAKQNERGAGSEMVGKDRPKPELTPDKQMRSGSDRQSYNERLTAEQQRAVQLVRRVNQRNAGAQRERGRDVGLER